MTESRFKVVALDSESVSDRLSICWSHLDDWTNLEIVKRCKKWLEEANAVFTPTTFVSYKDEKPVGMLEFMPQRLLESLGLCPCRVDERSGEVESRYILGEDFRNYLFISCLWVSKNHQGEGVGRTLLNHFLNSNVFQDSDGAMVYVRERDEKWDRHIHWPAGPKEFYQKAGFTNLKMLENPVGRLLSYRKGSKRNP